MIVATEVGIRVIHVAVLTGDPEIQIVQGNEIQTQIETQPITVGHIELAE